MGVLLLVDVVARGVGETELGVISAVAVVVSRPPVPGGYTATSPWEQSSSGPHTAHFSPDRTRQDRPSDFMSS